MLPMGGPNGGNPTNGGGQGLLDKDPETNQTQMKRAQRGNQDLWLLFLLFKVGSFLV
jgi:hypothetical protein